MGHPVPLTSAYSPENHHLWDTWFITDSDGSHHAFYLQAPRTFTPNERHDQASIGHAVSQDYKTWRELGTALSPGELGAWDDRALWTGSVILSAETGEYHQFYTGRSRQSPAAQKIGRAVSADLVEWRKTTVDRPLLEPVAPYSTSSHFVEGEPFPAWRDPFLFRNEQTGQYEMLITARLGDTPHNGCVARATSPDLDNWEATAPLFAPGTYDEVEVPQLIQHNGDNYLLFSTWAKGYNPGWSEAAGGARSGLHAYRSRGTDLSQPFEPVNGNGVVMSNGQAMYGVKLLERMGDSNDYLAAGWLNERPGTGEFVGAISTPFIVTIDGSEIGAKPPTLPA